MATYWADAHGLIHTDGHTLTMADARALLGLYYEEVQAAGEANDVGGMLRAWRLTGELEEAMTLAFRRRLVRAGNGRPVHRLDGNLTNNAPENLRIVDVTENRRRKP